MATVTSPEKPTKPAEAEQSLPKAPGEPSETEVGLLPPQHWAQLSEVGAQVDSSKISQLMHL
jgi:hypothetical protein